VNIMEAEPPVGIPRQSQGTREKSHNHILLILKSWTS
jgi:hypothetical protein